MDTLKANQEISKFFKLHQAPREVLQNDKFGQETIESYVHMSRINDVMEDKDKMYSVSFLKKHTDGSYYWPDKEYICDVDDTDVLKMSMPSEDILSGKAAIVRVKLSLDSGEVNAARSAFRVSIKNVCWVDEGEGPVTNLKLVVYNKLIDTFFMLLYNQL